MDLNLFYCHWNSIEFAIKRIRGVFLTNLFGLFGTKILFLFDFADSLQAQLINMGVIPTLVTLLGIHYQNVALTEMCLVAFGNLAELGKSCSWTTNVINLLMYLNFF